MYEVMDIFTLLGLFVWYVVAGIILFVIFLMLVRIIINQADFNPFSRPVMLVRRWTDPLVNPVRRPLVQIGFSPNIAPLVTILIAILLGYFALQFVGAVLGTAKRLVLSIELGAPVMFIGALLYGLLSVYSLMIFMRIVFSWGASPHNRVLRFLIRATEPILGPFRRVIPPLGMFDISPIVVLLLLDLLQRAIAGTLL